MNAYILDVRFCGIRTTAKYDESSTRMQSICSFSFALASTCRPQLEPLSLTAAYRLSCPHSLATDVLGHIVNTAATSHTTIVLYCILVITYNNSLVLTQRAIHCKVLPLDSPMHHTDRAELSRAALGVGGRGSTSGAEEKRVG